MELRRLSLCLALVIMAVCTQCSDAHSMHRREADDGLDYDGLMGDEANDDEAQNDADGGNDAEEEDSRPAVIQTLPTLYNVTVGRTIRLECKVEPAGAAVVQWSSNDQLLFMSGHPVSKNDRFSIAPKSNDLLIADVKPTDSGVYKCMVVQLQPIMIEHTLSVHESPRIVRFFASDNGTVVEGQDLLLTCDVAGSPPPQIMWSRDSENGNVRLQEKDGNFTLNSVFMKGVRREQAGKYYCYVMNGLGHAEAEVTVKVLHKPKVHVHQTEVNSAFGVEAVMQCSAHGEPIPSIHWYKDGNLIDSASSQYVITTVGAHSNLTVTPQVDQDFGTFTCVARNNHGKHNRSIELVQRPVVDALDFEGNKLTWTVHSHQPLDQIELQLRDEKLGNVSTITVPIPTPSGHQYEIVYVVEPEAAPPGAYEALVKARNDKGWSRPSEPMFINLAYNQRPSASALRLLSPYQTTYEVVYVVEPAAAPPGAYEALVKARNDKGWSRPNEPMFINLDTPAMSIQTASVFSQRGNHGYTHSIRPATVFFSTAIMYLLVRMF